mgnify:FL=1|tara:strand:+ start:3871 stop:4224 length:354 start_codon:yes stop_codon:yes gene_type:complete
MKIKIQKIETYSITHSTTAFTFEVEEFKSCTPAFIGKTKRDFMKYITTDVEDIKEFIDKNSDVLSTETSKKLYMLDVDPIYEVIEDSRNQYEDSWFKIGSKVDSKKKVSKVLEKVEK